RRSMLHLLSPLTRRPFSSTDPPTTALSTLSLHDALPIYLRVAGPCRLVAKSRVPNGERRDYARPPGFFQRRSQRRDPQWGSDLRSEEHTSELQSPYDLVCRLLLEKKNNNRVFAVLQAHSR